MLLHPADPTSLVCAAPRVSLAEMGPRDPRYWHLLIEARKLGYSDLHRCNADPAFEEVPTDRLLSQEHAATLCDEIDMDQARPARGRSHRRLVR